MYEEVIEMFHEYPVGMEVKLKDDYPNDRKVVVGYESHGLEWCLKFNDETSVNVKRLPDLLKN